MKLWNYPLHDLDCCLDRALLTQEAWFRPSSFPSQAFSTVRSFLTSNTPGTYRAAKNASCRSPLSETTPFNVTRPFFTRMWIGGLMAGEYRNSGLSYRKIARYVARRIASSLADTGRTSILFTTL